MRFQRKRCEEDSEWAQSRHSHHVFCWLYGESGRETAAKSMPREDEKKKSSKTRLRTNEAYSENIYNDCMR